MSVGDAYDERCILLDDYIELINMSVYIEKGGVNIG